MFVALGQLAQISTSSTWRLRAAPVQAATALKDWSGVASAADTLAQQAKTAGAVPVATAANDVKNAASETTSGGSPEVVKASVEMLMSVAESEDLASEVDRNLSGQLILQQMGQLSANITSFMAKHSGPYAIWDKLRGGADTSPLMAEVAQIQKMIDMTPLTNIGRQQLNARLAQAVASIKPEVDWGTIAVGFGTVGAFAAAKWALGKAQSVTVTHFQKRASKTEWGKKFGVTDEEEEKAKKKARAKRRKRAREKAESEEE